MERRTIIAHVLGAFVPGTLIFISCFKQNVDNNTDVEMLSRNYYQVEFELERMVPVFDG